MVEFIKEIVSGKKRRYRHDGLNLDFTYVTDRIVAMSFPSTGFESMYRNDIDDVVKLLTSKHGSNYLVLNLSERKYNYEKFNNQVIEFAWEDHHSPPLDLLFQACQTIDKFLNSDVKNIVVVHCLAGKGRTGTIISCYFLYCGRFDQVKQALKYYKLKRFERGGGVTQPSQIRYVHYFGYVLHGFLYERKIFSSSIVKIDRIILFGMPRISVGYFRPYVELYSVRKRKLIYSTKRPDQPIPKYVAKDDDQNEKVEILFPTKEPVVLAGDILVKVYHMGALGPKLAFRFGFNTAFLVKGHENQAILPLSIEELDPDSTKVDDRFPPKFYTEVHMTSLNTPGPENETPTPTTIPIPTRTVSATSTDLGSLENRREESAHWDAIYKILQHYKHLTPNEAAVLLFKDPAREDIERVLNGKVPFIKENTRVNQTPSEQEEEEEESSDSDPRDPQEDLKSEDRLNTEIIDPEEAEFEHQEEKESI